MRNRGTADAVVAVVLAVGLLAGCGAAPTASGETGSEAGCHVLSPEAAARALGGHAVAFPDNRVGDELICGYHLTGRSGTLAAYAIGPADAPDGGNPLAPFIALCSPPAYARERHATPTIRATLSAVDVVRPGALRCRVTTTRGVLLHDAVSWVAGDRRFSVYVDAGDDDDLPADAGLDLARLLAR